MNIFLVAAPDLSALTQGAGTLLLMEGLGFTSDSKLLLVKSVFLDSSETTNQQHFGVWLYEIASQQYVTNYNTLLGGGHGGGKTIDIFDAVISGASDSTSVIVQYGVRGFSDTPLLALISNGVVVDSNIAASFVGVGADIDIADFSLSQDGRFLAIQTSSGSLIPEGGTPDANEVDDIYLLDLKSHSMTRISIVSGQEGSYPSALGNVVVSGNSVTVSLTTASGFSTQDNGAVTSIAAANDAYVWTSNFSTTGLIGNSAIKLVSAATNKATGAVAGTLLEAVTTAVGTYFNSSSDAYRVDDVNGVLDPFLFAKDGVVRSIAIPGITNLSEGAVIAAVSENGKIISLLTHSPEVAGTSGADKLVVINEILGASFIASENDQSADGSVISAAMSSDGAWVAFSSDATNITNKTSPAIGGSLYLTSTGFQSSPVAKVLIQGFSTQGQTLTASHIDGLVASNFQWSAGGASITGATQKTLVLTQAQVGKTITVAANYPDVFGLTEDLVSSATSSVSNINDAPAGSVTISGTAKQGETLTAAHTLSDADGLGAISYQWSAAGVAIAGASSSSLVLGQAQVGKTVTVAASYTDGFGQAESMESSQTAETLNTNDAPVATAVTFKTDEDQIFKGVLTGFDLDDNTLSFEKVAGPVHGALLLNQTSGSFTYTPDANYFGTDSFVFKVNDGIIFSSSATVTINVNPVNDSPTIKTPSPDQKVTETEVLDFNFPIESFADIDSTNLTFTAQLASGLKLPEWLTFIPNELRFIAKPPDTVVGTEAMPFTVEVTATDASGASVSDNFDLIVKPNGYNINSTVVFWKSASSNAQPTGISNVALTEGGKNGTSNATGLISLTGALDLDGIDDGNMTLDPQLDPPSNAKSAITLTDVLATLKVYLNKAMPDNYSSPLNYIAADFDRSGTVTLSDVLQLLKYYLNKQNTFTPTWQFVDAADYGADGKTFLGANGANLAKDNTAPHVIDQTFDATHTSIELVGVLRGDVDGSWVAI